MLKRPRDAFDTPESSSPPVPASKRRHVSLSTAASSPRSALSTPYTLPYFRSPFSHTVPHDSPSNPFGLNRALRALTLPRPTGFSKHIVLRMQLVSTQDQSARSSVRSRRTTPAESPYRVVQVPLNYSFRLLHMLLLFLFASDADLRVRRRKRVFNHDLRARELAGRSRKAAKPNGPTGRGQDTEGEGHLFEVFEDVRLYNNSYRPGVMKSGAGKLYARLSSTRERKLFPDAQPSDGDECDVFGDGLSGAAGAGEEDEEDGWDWEAEDDFLLSSVWTDGPNLKKGIIYHHTPTTAIHITVNQTRVPPRKGIGNAPHVFAARGGTCGAVRIAHVARTSPSDPISSKPPSARTTKGKGKGKARSDLDSDSDDADDAEPNAPAARIDDGEEVPELGPNEEASEDQLERWNAHNAFDRFLKREAARERAIRRPADVPAASTSVSASVPATRTRRARNGPMSSPIAPRVGAHRYGHRYAYASGDDDRDPDLDLDGGADDPAAALPPSSPSTLPVMHPSDCEAVWTDTDGDVSARELAPDDDDDDDEAGENMRYMIELPLQTPFPAHPAVRRRVRRASERMERQVSKGLCEMDEDEESEKEQQGTAEGSKGGVRAETTASDARGGAGQGGEKPKAAKYKGKENGGGGGNHRPMSNAVRGEGGQATRRAPDVVKARPVELPTPVSDSEASGSDSDRASVESVEVDGFAMGAPWLYMRGPKEGKRGRGGVRWDSDEEV